ncbi:LLM class flavin-dependent oxidoreductase [Kribbella sp. NPDC056951]|uniref:LLM class flavin-dependent oxidoreductase n=1 Tax=Kribbella sp. NPDC056951 TaxID=3345978 RepID=UPI003644B3C9
MSRRLITALEIDGAGGHPGAWRGADVDPGAILTGSLALRAVQRAEAAGIDIATFADTLEAPADVADAVSVRLDALGLAARIAPATSRIGLLPTITVTHTEPFHVQASVATLDYVSSGRGGWVADVSTSAEAASVIGRREPAPAADLWREARYVVDVSRRLWDSWDDDAIIRDAPTGRFVDRDRLHYVDYQSPNFNIKGPSIVPRPPQGHPVTAVRVNTPDALEAAAHAELVLLPGAEHLAERVDAIRAAARGDGSEPAAGSGGPRVLVSVGVLLDADSAAAERRAEGGSFDYVGGVEGLADLVRKWQAAGVDGVHFRPASLELDVPVIAEKLLPLLQVAAADRPGTTLRNRLGLARPANRYANGVAR